MPELIPIIDDTQRFVLETLYGVFKRGRRWPTHQYVEKQLDEQGEYDLNEVLASMPGLFSPFNRAGGVIAVMPDESLCLRARGLACCRSAVIEVQLFVATIRWLLAEWSAVRPASPEDAVEPEVPAAALIGPLKKTLGRDPFAYQVELVLELLRVEPYLPTPSGPPDDRLRWTIKLNRELRRFRKVERIEDYLAMIPAETYPEPSPSRGTGTGVVRAPDPATIPDRDPRRVMVVHGRNRRARDAVFTFLRSLGLAPIEWEEAVAATQRGAPHNFDAVRAAMEIAQAVVVVLTAEDEARILPELAGPDDLDCTTLRGQPRQNVAIEAGLAMGIDAARTILVELGPIRRASDFEGLNVVRLTNEPARRAALRTRLITAGCRVEGVTDWLSIGAGGDFEGVILRPQQSADAENRSAPAEQPDRAPQGLEEVERSISRFLQMYSGIDQPFGLDVFREAIRVPETDMRWVERRLAELESDGLVERDPSGQGWYPAG